MGRIQTNRLVATIQHVISSGDAPTINNLYKDIAHKEWTPDRRTVHTYLSIQLHAIIVPRHENDILALCFLPPLFLLVKECAELRDVLAFEDAIRALQAQVMTLGSITLSITTDRTRYDADIPADQAPRTA